MSINWLTYEGFACPPCLPCCTSEDCCYFLGTGSGDGGSATGSLPTSKTATLTVTTTNSSPTLALNLNGRLAVSLQAGTSTITFSSPDSPFTLGAFIEGLTSDFDVGNSRTYTIPADGCYIIVLEADTGPGMFTTLSATVDFVSDQDINCASLEDRGFTPGGGGPGP